MEQSVVCWARNFEYGLLNDVYKATFNDTHWPLVIPVTINCVDQQPDAQRCDATHEVTKALFSRGVTSTRYLKWCIWEWRRG